jgi:hypothetical protein
MLINIIDSIIGLEDDVRIPYLPYYFIAADFLIPELRSLIMIKIARSTYNIAEIIRRK